MSDPKSYPDSTFPQNDDAGDGVETTGNNAAQGRRGKHVFIILVVSLALVVVALFGVFFLNLGPLSTNQGAGGQSGTNNPNAAAQFHTAPPSPKQAPPGAPSTTGTPQSSDTRGANTTS